MATLAEVILAVRELSFDRFVTPTMYIAGKEGYTISIDDVQLSVKSGEETKTLLTFEDHPTLQDICNALLSDAENYQVHFAASFIGTEPASSLLKTVNKDISEQTPLYRSQFFSDSIVKEIMLDYYFKHYDVVNATVADLEQMLSETPAPRDRHLTLWTAYHVVEKRRLYEYAALSMGGSETTGDLVFASVTGQQMSVSIGDVFTLENNPAAEDADNFDQVGADNILGDRNSFWYRLQLSIRDKFEQLFGDYNLRKDTVVQGRMVLEKNTNFYAHYDSYPYTISPYTRSLLSRGPK